MHNEKTFCPEQNSSWNTLKARSTGFFKALEEFVDDSISANARDILVRITQTDKDHFLLEVGDNGTGFYEEELSRVFGTCNHPDHAQTGVYNMFNKGMKSALASLDCDNANWKVYSSTDPEHCICVVAPYVQYIRYYDVNRSEIPTPPEWGSGSCTWISVPFDRNMLETCTDMNSDTDQERIDALIEELRVTYHLILHKYHVVLSWIPLFGAPRSVDLTPLSPPWELGKTKSGTEIIDLGSGELIAEYTFGRMIRNESNHIYYLGNTETSGVMLFLNGRLICQNIYKGIWNVRSHNSHNVFLFVLNLKSRLGKSDALPSPNPEKDGMVNSDPRYRNLLHWVRKLCPSPATEFALGYNFDEEATRNQLIKNLEASGNASTITTEMPPELSGVKSANYADVYARMADGHSILYEIKITKGTDRNLGQLTDYAMMAMTDGLQLDELVLLSKGHHASVDAYREKLLNHWYRGLPVPRIRLMDLEDLDLGLY